MLSRVFNQLNKHTNMWYFKSDNMHRHVELGFTYNSLSNRYLYPLSLTWINFNPGMDK